MVRILNIIGARPQIIKSAAMSRAVKGIFSDTIEEIILHTGQHYDENMSGVFFDEMGIPSPKYNLSVGSGSHGVQTALMITGMEEVLLLEKPDCAVVYGDTNSTLAAAVAASKLHVPIAHIEAGLRSFNKNMPEEINRIMCDHASTLLFTPTARGLQNLIREGFDPAATGPYSVNHPGVFHCGDIMYDNTLHFASIADRTGRILQEHQLEGKPFALVTLHRDHNTDHAGNMQSIFMALICLARESGLVFFIPLHPRSSQLLEAQLGKALYDEVMSNPSVKLAKPVTFLEMICLERAAKIILTDSGGVQKESYFFKKPCVILRPETEWTEIVDSGAAVLAGADEDRIIQSVRKFLDTPPRQFPSVFGDGRAAEFICGKLIENFA